MIRKLLVAAGVLVVLAGIGALVLVRNLDSLVASAIEDVGGRATLAPVSVGSVRMQLTEGTGAVEGLVVGNPEGFETPHAFAFGAIHVEMDPAAVTRRPVVVRRVTVDGCQVSYEWRPGGSNVARIEENLASFMSRLVPGGGGSSDGGTKIVIERFVIEGGRIDVSASFLGGRRVGAPLRAIVLENLGAEQGGATSGEIAAVVLASLSGSVLDAVSGLDIDGLDEVRSLREGLLDAAGRALRGVLGR